MKGNIQNRTMSSAIFVLCALLIILFFAFPSAASSGIKRGLSVCSQTLVPSLFPFMVISEILVRSGLGTYASRPFSGMMEKAFGVSGFCAGALILGILCGFPVGAKTTAALYRKGDISSQEASVLMSFCNYPSAPFMIFAVGKGLFGSTKSGILLYFSVLAAGLLCGIAGRAFRKCAIKSEKSASTSRIESSMTVFTNSVSASADALIRVCAYVCFFTCAVDCLSEFLANSNTVPSALLFSFFELTSGAAACAALEDHTVSVLLCCAAASWGGLSVLFQISPDTEEISMRPYLLSKLFTVPVSVIFTTAALKLFPDISASFPPAEDVFRPISLYPKAFIVAINIFFILSVLFYHIKLLDRRPRI